MSLVEQAKDRAAEAAFRDYIAPLLLQEKLDSRASLTIGIGSGSTIVYLIQHLAAFVEREFHAKGRALPAHFQCIPTSFQSRQLLVEKKLPVGDLDALDGWMEVAVDGADEVDAQLHCIKGGGGCQTQEKVVAANAKHFVVIADYRKLSDRLGTQWTRGVPLEVLPFARRPVENQLRRLGAKSVVVRTGAPSKAGPCISDNGNLLLDAEFGEISNPAELALQLSKIPGIVETGLFIGMAEHAYFGMEDGSVSERKRQ